MAATSNGDPRPISQLPRPGVNGVGRGYRESTVQSASDAAGIFDLYGPSRESYQSEAPSMGPDGHRMSQHQTYPHDEDEVDEELLHPDDGAFDTGFNSNGHGRKKGVDRNSGQSWSGPMEALSNRHSAASAQSAQSAQSAKSGQSMNLSMSTNTTTSGRLTPLSKSGSMGPGSGMGTAGSGTPNITITADNTPSKKQGSAGSSTSTSPTHPSTMRLSPRPPHLSLGGSSGSVSASSSTSQVSVGSSKYPGEEEDAFHVRSTCKPDLLDRLFVPSSPADAEDARLEAVGVHGDGWDPGVERTRGGPSQGRRATVIEVTRNADVGASEKEYLSNLDRYGFVNEPLRNRETRLALIPLSPLNRVPKLPSRSPLAGKPRPGLSMSGGDGSSPPGPPMPRGDPSEDSRFRRRENERVGKWMKMMKVAHRDAGGNILDWSWRSEVSSKVGKRVYKGVPDRWRMAAWWTLAEDMTRKGKSRQKTAEELGVDFRQSIDQPSTFDVQIDLDVPRTISGHTLFVTRYGAGQRSLFHVLHCFSMLCETCGYVQGMGPIAATLLCYFDPERVYALLVRLHDVYGMHTIFAPGFPGLLEAFYVQERLMEWLMPEVYNSFARSGVSSTAYGTKWYITLFVNTVPFSQQLRLWDALWLDGLDVLIMMAVAILWSYQDLLSAKNANFESILSLLSSFFVAEDEDKLMDWIRKMLGQQNVRRKMGEWREEWKGLVRDGQDGSALL